MGGARRGVRVEGARRGVADLDTADVQALRHLRLGTG